MKSSAAVSRVKVSADGHGVVSHAGVGMLRELADLTGLSAQVTAALADTYRGPWIYAPGAVFADLAAAVADGADCIDGVGQRCGDREHVFGPAASTTTMWRLVDSRVDAAHLPGIRAARAHARAAAWAAGAAPAAGEWLHLDVDATITIDHSDNKENAARDLEEDLGSSLAAGVSGPPRDRRWRSIGRAAATGKRRIEHRRRPRHRAGAGSGIAAGGLPARTRTILARNRFWCARDSAGATHTFAAACRQAGVGFSFGYPVDTRVRDAVEILNTNDSWYPAIDSDGGIRDGAWVAEATGLVEMSGWPAGTRLILRKERPHPGAQLRFTDSDGLRVTAFITDTAPGVVPGQLGGLELRHRQHARVEDRIRQAKATGLRNLPCHRADANAAWLEIIMAATDLVAWTKLLGFNDQPDLATMRDRHLPIPGPARRRPHHPRRPTDPVADRRHLAMGHRHLRRMATTTGRLHLTPSSPSTRPEDPPALETPARRAPPADSSCPDATISPTSRPAPAPSEPNRPREKSRLGLPVCLG